MAGKGRELAGVEKLRYPWTARRNPAVKRVEVACQRWVQRQGLFRDRAAAESFDHVGVGLLASHAYPDAEPDRLELAAQVMAWIYVEDDRYDLAPPKEQQPEVLEDRFERYLEVLRTAEVSATAEPAARALADLARRLMGISSLSWYDHFVHIMSEYWMDGVAVETYYRARGLSPDPASYMAMRVQTIGIYVRLALMELAADFELPAALREDPIMRRMAWLTSRIVAYVNDLFSYDKERSVGDVNNFLHVVRRHESMTVGDGIEHVVRVHDRDLEQFCLLDAAVKERGPLAERYVAGCRTWMSAALRWQKIAPRYASGRKMLEREAARMAAASSG